MTGLISFATSSRVLPASFRVSHCFIFSRIELSDLLLTAGKQFVNDSFRWLFLACLGLKV